MLVATDGKIIRFEFLADRWHSRNNFDSCVCCPSTPSRGEGAQGKGGGGSRGRWPSRQRPPWAFVIDAAIFRTRTWAFKALK